MKKSFLILMAAPLICSIAHAGPKVTYVGEGRYTCQGSATECAQIEHNNRQEAEYKERQYQREQDKAQAYVDQRRREEKERSKQ